MESQIELAQMSILKRLRDPGDDIENLINRLSQGDMFLTPEEERLLKRNRENRKGGRLMTRKEVSRQSG